MLRSSPSLPWAIPLIHAQDTEDRSASTSRAKMRRRSGVCVGDRIGLTRSLQGAAGTARSAAVVAAASRLLPGAQALACLALAAASPVRPAPATFGFHTFRSSGRRGERSGALGKEREGKGREGNGAGAGTHLFRAPEHVCFGTLLVPELVHLPSAQHPPKPVWPVQFRGQVPKCGLQCRSAHQRRENAAADGRGIGAGRGQSQRHRLDAGHCH